MLRAMLRQVKRELSRLNGNGTGRVQTGTVTGELEPQPIDPAWIEEGAPVARAATAVTAGDGTVHAGIWECTAGRFRWTYEVDEVVQVLEGEAFIEIDLASRRIGPGDFVLFPCGATVRWHVPRYIRKAFFLSRAGRRLPALRLLALALCVGLGSAPADEETLTDDGPELIRRSRAA